MVQGPFQDWLDRVVQSYFDDDFASYSDAMLLPQAFITDKSITLIGDEDLLRKGFDAWRQMMIAQKVTHLIRTATEVVELGGGLISGNYETHLLSDATHVCPVYTSTATLREDGGVWRAVSITTGLSNTAYPIVVPRVT